MSENLPDAPTRISLLYLTQPTRWRSLEASFTGILRVGTICIPCQVGRSGLTSNKREGDGGTPRGRFRMLKRFFRPDRWKRQSQLVGLSPQDGWCDDPRSRSYNFPITLPAKDGHEELWRADHVYDVLIVLDFNLRPRVRGRGSAIFFHLARPDKGPTAGCVAISAADMRRLLPRLGRKAAIEIR